MPSSPASRAAPVRTRLLAALTRWFDTAHATPDGGPAEGIDWLRALPFLGMHLACLAVFTVGVSPVAVATAIALYAIRMFAITGFYHRYFSHRTFRTSRAVQFAFALIGASCVQRGPLWLSLIHI